MTNYERICADKAFLALLLTFGDEEEFNEWIDTEKVDWIYVDGEIHLFNRFFSTMKKVYPDIAKRCGIAKTDENFKLLEKNMSVMKQKGYNIDLEQLKSEIAARDKADSERAISPLIKTPDAFLLDSTSMTIEAVVDKILSLIS